MAAEEAYDESVAQDLLTARSAGGSSDGTGLRKRLTSVPETAPRVVGRCQLYGELAHGGMATVHLGRWIGDGGFAKTVAVKALHRQYANDPEVVKMFMDEARVVSRIKHPNVMPIMDMVEERGELFIVMEYVHGVSLGQLCRMMASRGSTMPLSIAKRVMTEVLHGLHAAHEATDERGQSLALVHRDVTPDNILVGTDGHARLIDFGIASSMGRFAKTQDGEMKGKMPYLSPEQVLGEKVDRRTDIYSASIVFWQMLTAERLFTGTNIGAISRQIVTKQAPRPSTLVDSLGDDCDDVIERGLAKDPDDRWATAAIMADEIAKGSAMASPQQVGDWVAKLADKQLSRHRVLVETMEAAPWTEPQRGTRREQTSLQATGLKKLVASIHPEAPVSLPTKPPLRRSVPAVVIGAVLLITVLVAFAMFRSDASSAKAVSSVSDTGVSDLSRHGGSSQAAAPSVDPSAEVTAPPASAPRASAPASAPPASAKASLPPESTEATDPLNAAASATSVAASAVGPIPPTRSRGPAKMVPSRPQNSRYGGHTGLPEDI